MPFISNETGYSSESRMLLPSATWLRACVNAHNMQNHIVYVHTFPFLSVLFTGCLTYSLVDRVKHDAGSLDV